MNRYHVELVRDVLTRAVNGERVDPQEYGLALLACDEALKEADQSAATETQTGVCPNCGYVIALPAPEPAPCIHRLNELGHCTRCGARPNDKS